MATTAQRLMSILTGFVTRRRATPTQSMGTGGTSIIGGFIQEQEKDRELLGRQKYTTYSDILSNVAIVAAGVRYFLNLISKSGWKVEPADDSDEAKRMAELVEEMMEDMTTPWHRIVRRAAGYRFYGFSAQEWTAKKRDDGVIAYLDIEPRPQFTIERWDVDVSGTVLGMVQRSPQTQEELYLPRQKMIYVVDDSLNDSPEGLGLFRHIVESARRLQRYEQLEGFGFETDLRGIPVGRAPIAELEAAVAAGTITAEDRDKRLAEMVDFIKNHIRTPNLGIVLDSTPYSTTDDAEKPSPVLQWSLELLRGDATGGLHEAVSRAIQRVVRDIAMVLGVESLLLGTDGSGSLALSRDKSHNFALIVDSSLLELKETFESDFLGPLWRMNGWDEALKPTLKTEQVRYRDVEQVTGALDDMARAGAPLEPDDPAVDEVRELLGLSRTPQEIIDRLAEMAELGRLGAEAAIEANREGTTVVNNNGGDGGGGGGEKKPDEGKEEEDTEKLLLPKEGETRRVFTKRFMKDSLMVESFPEQKHRSDVATKQWKNRGKE